MSGILELEVTGDHSVPVTPSAGGTVTVLNQSGDTLYYADNAQVSAGNNQGSLTATQSATFSLPQWLRSASLSTVQVTFVDPAVATATASTTTDPTIWLPTGWGAFTKAAALTGKFSVAVAGDSIARGGYSSNTDTKGWVGLMHADLLTKYGDGGSGYKSTVDVGAIGLSGWSANSIATANPWVPTGTWAKGSPTDAGPGNYCLFSSTLNDTLASPSGVVKGTTLRIYTVNGAGNGTCSYSIDAGAATGNIDTSIGSGVVVTTVSGLAAGAHQITFTITSTAKNVLISGVSGENATGAVVNNFSIPGCQSNNFAGKSYNGGVNYPAALAIWACGVNDSNAGITDTAFATNFGTWANTVKANTDASNGATDLMILVDHVGQFNGAGVYGIYSARLRGLAQTYNAALVDMWTVYRNSWPYAFAQNFWSDNNGNPGNSTVHPSDIGHAAIYAKVKGALQTATIL